MRLPKKILIYIIAIGLLVITAAGYSTFASIHTNSEHVLGAPISTVLPTGILTTENLTSTSTKVRATLSQVTPRTVVASQNTAHVMFVIQGKQYSADIPNGATVINAMDLLAAAGTITYTKKEYEGLGSFIESINGKSGADGKYWFFYINGKKSETGASTTRLSAGDIIEWKYE